MADRDVGGRPIRALGYDPASGYADAIIDRWDPRGLGAILEIFGRTERT